MIDQNAGAVLFLGSHRVLQVEHDRVRLEDEGRAHHAGGVARHEQHAAPELHHSTLQSISCAPAARSTAACTRALMMQSSAPLSETTTVAAWTDRASSVCITDARICLPNCLMTSL